MINGCCFWFFWGCAKRSCSSALISRSFTKLLHELQKSQARIESSDEGEEAETVATPCELLQDLFRIPGAFQSARRWHLPALQSHAKTRRPPGVHLAHSRRSCQASRHQVRDREFPPFLVQRRFEKIVDYNCGMICRCVVAELKKLGEAYSGTALAARRLDLIRYSAFLALLQMLPIARV